MRNPKNKTDKSIFVLHVYEAFGARKKLAYGISGGLIKMGGTDTPGFLVFEIGTAYYQTLAEAEKKIQKIAKLDNTDLYGFFVEEKPLDRMVSPSGFISARRYLKDGKYCPPPRFKKGDIVEFMMEDSVNLGIVWESPASLEDLASDRSSAGDETYALVYYEVGENGRVTNNFIHRDSVNVLPPSLPVPKKFAAELRRQLKLREIEGEDELPF